VSSCGSGPPVSRLPWRITRPGTAHGAC
jgi:hypothetical protein